MTLPQPGQVRKVDTNITLSSSNDTYLTPTVSGSRFMYNGSQFVLLEYDTNTNRMEANVWSNNGTEVANFYFSKKYLLDVNFDKFDGVYYGLRWNNDSSFRGGGFTFSPQSEGGAESATGLLVDDFDSSRVWHVDGIEYLRLDSYIRYSLPTISVSRDKKRWTSYLSSVYTGGSLDSSWSSEGNFSQVLENRSTNLFQVDTTNSKLAYYSNTGLAHLDFDVDINGDFLASLDLNATTFLSDSIFCFRALRKSEDASLPYNHLATLAFRGPVGAGGERLECWGVSYLNDTSCGAWDVCNLRLDEKNLQTGGFVTSPETGKTFRILIDDYYRAASNQALRFKVTDLIDTNYGRGIISSNASTSDSQADGDLYRTFSWVRPSGRLFSFDAKSGYTWDDSTGVFTDHIIDSRVKGSSKDVVISHYKESSPPMDNLRIALKRIGTTIYFLKRDKSIPGGSYTLIQSYDLGYSGPVRLELYADGTAGGSSPNISVDKLVVRGLLPSESGGSVAPASASWPHSVFTIELFDLDGNPKYVAGRSDAGGNVISRLDVIKAGIDKGGDFADFFNRSQIATNHEATVSGEVYINIKRDFYKYAKADLPLNDTVESGTVAELIVGGALFGDPKYNTLNWNGYTQAGLYYISGNTADPGSGRYLNCIRSTTMSGNNPVKFAWLEQAGTYNDFYAADVNQPYLLYGLSDSDRKVYMYNLNEDSSAFCNVVSNKQIMGANTGDVSTVTAQVLNVYGDPLEGKTVLFEISSGDGSVSPGSDVTDALGEATTTYTVGATVGTAQIEATVTN